MPQFGLNFSWPADRYWLLSLNQPYVAYYLAIFNKMCWGRKQQSAVKIDYRFCDCVNGILYTTLRCCCYYRSYAPPPKPRDSAFLFVLVVIVVGFRLVLFIFWSDSFRQHYDFDSTNTCTYTWCNNELNIE